METHFSCSGRVFSGPVGQGYNAAKKAVRDCMENGSNNSDRSRK